jgi:hypothetical protein
MINFCYDELGANPRLGYPNLARPALQPWEFDQEWPRVVPLRLLMYLDSAGLPFRAHLTSQCPAGSWYPIALAWFDFAVDYFGLISPCVLDRIRQGEIKVLFYYHEGDNPGTIKQRLDGCLSSHDLPRDCYMFVSANTAASDLENFCYFGDHEFFFRYVNRHQAADPPDSHARPYQFTALNRTHKWWRATIMSDLVHLKVLKSSQWSYNTSPRRSDSFYDNPLRLDILPNGKKNLRRFMDRGPYWCDGADAAKHNDHSQVNLDLYNQSYVHLVLETHFDADQSGGSFLTEKTYKCLKFGQPFVIFGPRHSLRCLRDRGYRVFDEYLDNSYDDIEDNTPRYLAARKVVTDLAAQDLHQLYVSVLPDLLHNQQLFCNGDTAALRRLLDQLKTRTPY